MSTNSLTTSLIETDALMIPIFCKIFPAVKNVLICLGPIFGLVISVLSFSCFCATASDNFTALIKDCFN